MVVVLTLVTCGVYWIYWFFQTQDELRVTGYPSTANTTVTDFLVCLVTCGAYAIFVDWRTAKSIAEMQDHLGLHINDRAIMATIFNLVGLRIVSMAILQNELNRVWNAIDDEPPLDPA
jgi:hypothetical protein